MFQNTSRNIFEKSKLYKDLALHRHLFRKDRTKIELPKFSIQKPEYIPSKVEEKPEKNVTFSFPVVVPEKVDNITKPYDIPKPIFTYEINLVYSRIRFFKPFPVDEVKAIMKLMDWKIKFHTLESHYIHIVAASSNLEQIKMDVEQINSLLAVEKKLLINGDLIQIL